MRGTLRQGSGIAAAERQHMPRRKKSKIKNWVRRMLDISDHSSDLIKEPDSADYLDEYAHAERNIRFTVYMANGGQIIESRRVDKNTGDHTYSLTVIGSDGRLGEAIEKILTIEGLR